MKLFTITLSVWLWAVFQSVFMQGEGKTVQVLNSLCLHSVLFHSLHPSICLKRTYDVWDEDSLISVERHPAHLCHRHTVMIFATVFLSVKIHCCFCDSDSLRSFLFCWEMRSKKLGPELQFLGMLFPVTCMRKVSCAHTVLHQQSTQGWEMKHSNWWKRKEEDD